jgi:fibronectin-binding autotransporter adhesin
MATLVNVKEYALRRRQLEGRMGHRVGWPRWRCEPAMCGAKRTRVSRIRVAARWLFGSLAALSLGVTAAHAQNATWSATPGSADWDTAGNWTPTTVPTGTATFSASAVTGLTFSAGSTSINNLQFNSGAPAYTFTVGNQLVTVAGTGVVDNSSNKPTFVVSGNSATFGLSFTNAATAGNANFSASNAALLQFFNTASAANATISLTGIGQVDFNNSSTAGNASITATGGGNFFFTDNSSAANATINYNGADQSSFAKSSSAGNANITIGSSATGVGFFDSSSAANAVISNSSAGTALSAGLAFIDSSSAGNATITNNPSGTLSFGQYTYLTGNPGSLNLNAGTGSAGNATITNYGTTTFYFQSDAGAATITNNGGTLNFNSQSTADSATINNPFGFIFFNDSATAGNSSISNQGEITFANNSTAGNANITTQPGGFLLAFADSSTAGNATITTGFASEVLFTDSASGGTARFIVNGSFDMSGLTSGGMTAGSIEGSGSVFLGGNALTVGGNNLSTTFSGSIQDGGSFGGIGGSLTKIGTGTLTLTGASTYTGATAIDGGTLAVNGSIMSPVTVNSGGTLAGTGEIAAAPVMNAGGVVAPGPPGGIGTLIVGGNYTQSAGGTLSFAVTPSAASKLVVNGTASLGGALAFNFAPGTYTTGMTYTLLTAPSLTGTFSGITGPNASNHEELIIYENTPTDPSVLLELGPEIAPTNDTIYSAVTSIAIINAQQVNGIILDRIGARSAGVADGQIAALAPGGVPGLQVAQAGGGNGGTLGEVAAALPGALPSQGMWFRGIGGFASVNGSSSAPGFTGSTGGFLAGYDWPVLPNVYLGVAGGYLHSNIDEHSTSNGTEGSARLNAYGGLIVGPSLFSLTTGYANDRFVTNRGFAGVGTANEQHSGNEATAAGQWSLPLPMQGYGGGIATVTPKAGIQYLHLSEDAFSETGASGFDLANSGHGTDSLQPYVGAALAQKFVTDSGSQITPEVRLGYAYEVYDSRLLTVTSVSGTAFPVEGVKPSRDQLTAGIGLTMTAGPNLSLYADYDAILPTGNTTEQTIQAGLRLKF